MPGQGGVPGRRRAPLGQNGVAKSPHKDILMPSSCQLSQCDRFAKSASGTAKMAA